MIRFRVGSPAPRLLFWWSNALIHGVTESLKNRLAPKNERDRRAVSRLADALTEQQKDYS